MIFRALSNKERIQLVFSLSLLFFFLIPNFILRAGIAIFALIFILSSISEIKRETVFLLLFLFYCFAYIYSPYYVSFQEPWLRILSLVLLFLFGLFWAHRVSSSLKLNFKPQNKFLLIILGIMIYIVNYIPLEADIPWRGDEDYHIYSIITLSNYMDVIFKYTLSLIQKNIFMSFLTGLILLIIFRKVSSRYKLPVYKKIIILILFTIILFSSLNLSTVLPVLKELNFLVALRYPFVQRWFNLFSVFPDLYGEISLYRGVPFLAVIFISFFLFYKFNEAIKSKWESLFLAFSMITVPLLYFYSSLLYLEMPIVLLMTICVFDIKSIIFLESKELLTRPSWYCLLLISFLKETVLVFLMVIICVRIIYQVRFIERSKKRLLYELTTGLLILTPLFLYLFFRLVFANFRAYGMEFHNLFKISNYFIFGKGLFNQLGILTVITIAGLFLLFKKDRFLSMVLLLLFLVMGCFFIVDGSYIGYSRWNLFLIPVIFSASFNFIVSLSKYFRVGIMCSLILSNILLSPFHLDGVRLPNWGSPKADTAEYVYPYDKTVKWLSSQKNIRCLLVMGYYHYRYSGFYFYFNKYHFYPQKEELPFGFQRFDKDTELAMFNSFFLEYPKLENFDTVNVSILDKRQRLLSVDTILYHSVNNIDLDDKILYGGVFKVVKKISNSEHSLYILRKLEI